MQARSLDDGATKTRTRPRVRKLYIEEEEEEGSHHAPLPCDEAGNMPSSDAEGTYPERSTRGFESLPNSETEGTYLEATSMSEKHQPARNYRDSHSTPLGSGTLRRSKSSHETVGESSPRYTSSTRPKDYSSVPSRPGTFNPRHKSRSCSNLDDLRRAVEHLYRNYHQCRQCGSKDLVHVKDKRDAILLVSCNNCSHGFGVDDHMEPDIILELYRQGCLEVHVGCCSNTDPDLFEIVGVEGVKLWVRCMQCEMVSVMGEGEEGNGAGQWRQWRDGSERKEGWGGGEGAEDSDGRDELGALVCPCGNRDQDNMSVVLFEEEVRCLICDICQETINFPEALRPESDCPGVTDSQENTHDPAEFVSCKCPPTQKKIVIRYDDSGSPEIIACANCQFFYLPKDPPQRKSEAEARSFGKSQSMPETQSTSSGKPTWFRSKVVPMVKRGFQSVGNAIKVCMRVSYRDVEQISELRPGDHIMWERDLGYRHHAIVVPAEEDDGGCRGKIWVVHYSGPSPSGRKAEIFKEELDPFAKGLGRLFLVDYSKLKEYDPSSVLSPDEVLRNADSKLREEEYSVLANNCEHFATWCKTGLHVSSQVMKVMACFLQYFHTSTCGATGNALEVAAVTQSARVWGRCAAGFAVVMAGTVFIVDAFTDIKKANEDRLQGHLSRDAYLEVVVKRVLRSTYGLAGTALGLCIPIPALAVVGGTLGGMIGEYIGKMIGGLIVKGCEELKEAFGQGEKVDDWICFDRNASKTT